MLPWDVEPNQVQIDDWDEEVEKKKQQQRRRS
jgi:hypothetical protein